MFTFSFERSFRILFVKFSGVLDSPDIDALYGAADRFFTAEGSVDALVDFTAVTSVSLPIGSVIERGKQRPPNDGHRRVIVAPQLELYGLARVYGAYQELRGWTRPHIVKTRAEAFALLGLANPRFEPVTIAPEQALPPRRPSVQPSPV